jgi:micrococcal nuclease
MIRRSFRIGLWLGLLAGIAFALSKILRPKAESSAIIDLGSPGASLGPTPEPIQIPEPEPAPAPTPAPVKKAVAKKPAAKKAAPKKLAPWVDPDGKICPQTHPVKGKLSSMIFQAPGNFAYDRTTPDRCYESPLAAEADGLRAAKR